MKLNVKLNGEIKGNLSFPINFLVFQTYNFSLIILAHNTKFWVRQSLWRKSRLMLKSCWCLWRVFLIRFQSSFLEGFGKAIVFKNFVFSSIDVVGMFWIFRFLFSFFHCEKLLHKEGRVFPQHNDASTCWSFVFNSWTQQFFMYFLHIFTT